MTFGGRELKAALNGLASVPIVVGGNAVRGYRDEESADVLSAGGEYTAQAVRRSLLLITVEIPAAMVEEAEITIEGVSAIVRQLVPLDDGALTRLIYVPA